MVQPNGPEELSPPALVMQMITGHWVSQLVGSLCRLGMLPGRERTLKEYKVLLDVSGLAFERVLPTHSPFQIIEASKMQYKSLAS